jgi:hypothetical protein
MGLFVKDKEKKQEDAPLPPSIEDDINVLKLKGDVLPDIDDLNIVKEQIKIDDDQKNLKESNIAELDVRIIVVKSIYVGECKINQEVLSNDIVKGILSKDVRECN